MTHKFCGLPRDTDHPVRLRKGVAAKMLAIGEYKAADTSALIHAANDKTLGRVLVTDRATAIAVLEGTR